MLRHGCMGQCWHVIMAPNQGATTGMVNDSMHQGHGQASHRQAMLLTGQPGPWGMFAGALSGVFRGVQPGCHAMYNPPPGSHAEPGACIQQVRLPGLRPHRGRRSHNAGAGVLTRFDFPQVRLSVVGHHHRCCSYIGRARVCLVWHLPLHTQSASLCHGRTDCGAG